MTVLQQERELYDAVWGGLSRYGDHNPGEHHVDLFKRLLEARGWPQGSVLDAGCGTGLGGVALQRAGFQAALCDLTDAGLQAAALELPFTTVSLWDDLRPALGFQMGGKFDYGYCCDVLEHIPEAFTMLVVSQLLAVARYGVFLTISTVPDHFGIWVGEPLHKTVRPFTWWRDMLGEVGTVTEAIDCLNYGAFLVEA